MRQYSQKISLYGVMTRRYSKMLARNSYWHFEQGGSYQKVLNPPEALTP